MDVVVFFVGPVCPVSGRALRIDDWNHHLAGPAPDASPGLGPHFHDVLAKGAAGKGHGSNGWGLYAICAER